MRAAAALALLAASLLASGCVQEAKPGGSSPAPGADLAYAVPPLPKVDAAGLLADLKSFAAAYPVREGTNPLHEGARQWISRQFAADGYTVHRQNFTTGGLAQANILGIKWGAQRDQWVVVGGHYDTTRNLGMADTQSQGAYDDGSGTMMSVRLAKAWANVTSAYTIAFVTYDGEERGLEGATAFVQAVTDGTLPWPVTLRGALDMDMFGITWPGTQAPTQILDNSDALHKVFDGARKAIGMPDGMAYCSDAATLGSSDFQAYFDHQVPTVFFSSDFGKVAPPGSPEPLPFFAYPFWHQLDTYDTMQAMAGGATPLLQGFTTATTLAAAELHALADQPGLHLDVHAPPSSAPNPTASC